QGRPARRPSGAVLLRRIVPAMSVRYALPPLWTAPPLPPPGVPRGAGFAPQPMAALLMKTLLRTSHWTLMLLSAPPLEQRPPRNVSPVIYTGRFLYWASTRMAPPPRSGP